MFERASRDAVTAPDAVGLLKSTITIRVLHDGAVRRAGREATGLRTVHATGSCASGHISEPSFFAYVSLKKD